MKPLVWKSLRGEGRAVELFSQKRCGFSLLKLSRGRTVRIRFSNLGQHGFDIWIVVPLSGLLLKDEVGPHATARKILHSVIVFRAVSMGVEVTRPVIAYIFQELHQPERSLGI